MKLLTDTELNGLDEIICNLLVLFQALHDRRRSMPPKIRNELAKQLQALCIAYDMMAMFYSVNTDEQPRTLPEVFDEIRGLKNP